MTDLVRRLKRALLAPIAFPQYAAVGLTDPQDRVAVRLTGVGDAFDVTRDNVVAALRPFTIGVMLDERRSADVLGRTPIALEFLDAADPGRLLGIVHLQAVQELTMPGHRFVLFQACGSRNRTLHPLRMALYHLAERRRARRRQRENPHNFEITPADLEALFVFYACPRPVVLVSVEHAGSSNIFPMDLIGPTDSPWFSFALRTTSPAVALMQQSRRFALADIPLAYKAAAYALGRHHREATVDWSALPFATMRSSSYGLRVPADAIRVREARVEETRQVGSHTLFLTSIVSDERSGSDRPGSLQLFHVHGAFQQYLRRRGRALPEG